MKSVKYLENLSEVTGMNDNQLAKKLGLTRSSISQYKSGKRVMENETCIAVALELGIDPIKIIMAADIDRAERAGQHSLWEVFIQRTAQTSSAALGVFLLVFVTMFLTPPDANASVARVTGVSHSQEYKLCELYIFKKIS